jgi:hypothetical protein
VKQYRAVLARVEKVELPEVLNHCLLDRSIAVMGPDDRDLPGATGDQTVEFWSLFGSTGRSTKPPV